MTRYDVKNLKVWDNVNIFLKWLVTTIEESIWLRLDEKTIEKLENDISEYFLKNKYCELKIKI